MSSPLEQHVFNTTLLKLEPPEDLRTLVEKKTSPVKKKKKYRWVDRTSLNHRNQHGKPGSRRHQRYLNVAHLTDSEDESDSEDDEDILFEWHSTFQSLLESSEKLQAFEPFLEIDDDIQTTALEEQTANIVQTNQRRPSTNGIPFIDKYSRKAILKYAHSEFLSCLESVVIQFITTLDEKWLEESEELISNDYFTSFINNESLVIVFTDSFHRLIAHSISRYYSLLSYSEDWSSSERVTIIRKPHTSGLFLPPPVCSIIDVLRNQS